jgi:hypothetical protein
MNFNQHEGTETLLIRKQVLLVGLHSQLNDILKWGTAKDKEFQEELSEQFYKIRASNHERFKLLIPANNEQEGAV